MAILNMFKPAVSGEQVVQLSYLDWLESQESERAAKYATFREYYDGEQATQLTARMRKFLELKADQEFSLNICPLIVDSLAEKLMVARFDCEDESDLPAEWWSRSRMDAVQMVTHRSAVRDGDTYVICSWDNANGRPRFTHENAWDGTDGTHIVYSDENRETAVVAIKRWLIRTGAGTMTRRTNLYFPDRIEKYYSVNGSTWMRYEEDGKPWPIPWIGHDGKPLGIPVVHFRNRDQGYSYGESELDDVLPIQNALNKAFIDLLAAADTTGFRNYWMTGGKPPDDMVTAPGTWIWHEDPAARIGVMDGASLDGLIQIKDTVMADGGKITRTPLSFFQLTGQVAAAGTLKEQRSGLIAKARDRQTVFGNAWEDLMYFARCLHNTFGDGGLDESLEVSAIWKDDEKPDPKELAEEVELLTRAQAASIETKVRILHPDWTKDEIAAEVKTIRAEQAMDVPDIGPLP